MNDENLIDIDELEEVQETEIPQNKQSVDEKKPKKKEKLSPTDDIITDNLVEAFALLSSMLDETKATKENIERVHEAILKLLDVVTQLRDVSEELSKVNQIVKEINVLVKAISVNNSNIKDLIDVIYKITDRQKKVEKDVDSIKNEMFFVGNEGNKNQKSNSWIQIINFALNAGILFLLFILLKKGGL